MRANLNSKHLRGRGLTPVIVSPGYGSSQLHLRQSEEQIRALLGKPDRIVRKYKGQYYFDYLGAGIELDFGRKGGRVKYIYFFRDGVERHHASDVVTTEGISLGDHDSKVIKVYGQPDGRGDEVALGRADFLGRWMTYNMGINFEFGPDRRVGMITILRPTVRQKK